MVSAVASPSRSRNGWATVTRPASAPPRQAYDTKTSPGRNRPRPSRCTSPCRSSAMSSRDVVLLASPVAAVSSVNVSAPGPCTTWMSSCAARSTAWVPVGTTATAAVPGLPREEFMSARGGSCLDSSMLRNSVLRCDPKIGLSPGQAEVAMFVNRMPRYEPLSPDAIDVLDKGWRRIVSEIGVQFAKPEAVELFRRAGQGIDGDVVRLDPDFVLEQVAKAPREFDVQARNPAHNVHIGGDSMA